MRGAPFRIVDHAGTVEWIPGSKATVFDHQEWLQLTIGSCLAPARLDPKRPGRVIYLLDGRAIEAADPAWSEGDASNAVARSAALLRDGLARVGKLLAVQIDNPNSPRLQVLASLQTLVELRLPSPDARCVHLVDGGLVLSGWGIVSESSVRLGDLLATEARLDKWVAAVERAMLAAIGSGEAAVRPVVRSDAPHATKAKRPRGRQAAVAVPRSTGSDQHLASGRKWLMAALILIFVAIIVARIVWL